MSTPTCACGKLLLNSRERCLACYDKRSKRYSFHAYTPARSRPTDELTPPPSDLSSPRPSLDATTASSRLSTSSSTRSSSPRSRPGFLLDALNSAFASEEGIANFLPPAHPAYHSTSSRTSSHSSRRPSSSSSFTRYSSLSATSSTASSTAGDDQPARRGSETVLTRESPEPGLLASQSQRQTPSSRHLHGGGGSAGSSTHDPGYAPMAAGFARLGVKGTQAVDARGRSIPHRSGMALEAKWFDGPA